MTFPSEKFCLKWSEFQQNIISSFHDLGKDKYFSDVTLVCEEDQQIEAHKIILAACSPFFSTLLKKNKHSHPMIYMRGLKAKDLVAVVDFIYHGETNIYQEDLDGFLALAEELQLKGLDKEDKEVLKTITEEPFHRLSNSKAKKREMSSPEVIPNQRLQYRKQKTDQALEISVEKYPLKNFVEKKIIVHNTEDLKTKLDSMIENNIGGAKAWKCTECGREIQVRRDMRRHVETHVEGLSYPCNLCDAVKRSSNSLNSHISIVHYRT